MNGADALPDAARFVALLGAAMRRDNKNRTFGFMKDPFANATHKQLTHRSSPMRSNNNHVCIEFLSLLQNGFSRIALHKEGSCIHAGVAQSFCNRLKPPVLIVE